MWVGSSRRCFCFSRCHRIREIYIYYQCYKLIHSLGPRINPWRYRHGYSHRHGRKANAYKYPLTFLKWWSSLVLKTFTVPADNSIPQSVPLLTNCTLANLNFPTSKRYLFLNSLKLCPLLVPSPITWKNLSGSKFLNLVLNHGVQLPFFSSVFQHNSCIKLYLMYLENPEGTQVIIGSNMR